MPAPSVAAIGAWKGGLVLEGSRSRRPAATRCRRGASNGGGVRRAANGLHGRPAGIQRRGRRHAKASQRGRNRRHAGAARRPRGPRKGRGELDGALEEASAEGLPGRHGTGPRAAERRPRTRRTSRASAAAGKKRRVPGLQGVPFSLILHADAATFAAMVTILDNAPAPPREGPQARHARAARSRTGSG